MYFTELQANPFWFTISCNKIIEFENLDFICEIPNNSVFNSEQPRVTQLNEKQINDRSFQSAGCRMGWFRLEEQCMKVIPLVVTSPCLQFNLHCHSLYGNKDRQTVNVHRSVAVLAIF